MDTFILQTQQSTCLGSHSDRGVKWGLRPGLLSLGLFPSYPHCDSPESRLKSGLCHLTGRSEDARGTCDIWKIRWQKSVSSKQAGHSASFFVFQKTVLIIPPSLFYFINYSLTFFMPVNRQESFGHGRPHYLMERARPLASGCGRAGGSQQAW